MIEDKKLKSLKYAATGKRNKAAGELWENIISVSCDYYSNIGEAEIEKTPEPMRPIRRLNGGQFVAVFTKSAQPDYKGTLKNGHSIVFEAKHTDTDRIRKEVISPEQEKRLNNHLSLGAECFVLISFGFVKFFKVPWEWFRDMKLYHGRKYVTPDDLKKFEVKYNGRILSFLNE